MAQSCGLCSALVRGAPFAPGRCLSCFSRQAFGAGLLRTLRSLSRGPGCTRSSACETIFSLCPSCVHLCLACALIVSSLRIRPLAGCTVLQLPLRVSISMRSCCRKRLRRTSPVSWSRQHGWYVLRFVSVLEAFEFTPSLFQAMVVWRSP